MSRAKIPDEQRAAALARYRKARAKGAKRLDAARKAGVSLASIEKWIEAEGDAPPVAIVRDRPCLGGCGKAIKSTGSHHRLCDACSGRVASLPAVWSA